MDSPANSPILILTNEFAPARGGIATYVEETARAAAECKREVVVWAPGIPRRDDASLPFTVRRLGLRGNQNWPDRLRLRRALRRAPVNWEQTTLYLPEPGPIRLWLYAGWLGLPRPGRLVLTFHGSELLYLGAWPHRRGRLARLCARADRIGVVSQYVLDLLEKTVPRAGAKAVVVPGAPAHAYAALAADARPNPAPPSPSHPFRLVSVARVHPRKGIDLALDAIARLPAELRHRIRYDIIGPARKPAYARELSRKAREADVTLNFLGTLDERQIAGIFRAADLLLFPSRELPKSVEGLGLSILEAALLGLPTVATHTGGTGEAVENGVTGLLVPPDDPAALATVLESCLRNPALRHHLGAKAADRIPSRFSWKRNAEALFT